MFCRPVKNARGKRGLTSGFAKQNIARAGKLARSTVLCKSAFRKLEADNKLHCICKTCLIWPHCPISFRTDTSSPFRYHMRMDIQLLRESIAANVQFIFARSGGKGGQNVNKVNTKVHAAIAVNALDGITEDERLRLRARLGKAVNSDGEIFVDVQDERFQERNRLLSLKRLEVRIVAALAVKKRRIKTKPSKAAKERRLKVKKIVSDKKNGRKRVIL